MDEKTQELLDAATQLVSEFVLWGEVLQVSQDDDQDHYGRGSAVGRLAAAVNAVEPGRFDLDENGEPGSKHA